MEYIENLKTHKIKKGTILLHQGDQCNYGYKVISGCLKSYVIDHSGKEHIVQFAPEDWIISDMNAVYNKKPSSIFIDAVEDTKYIKMDATNFEAILNSDHNILMQNQQKLVRNLISLNKRIIALLSSTAMERYEEFMETYPTIVQRLPLKLIASYIGITPEYLSEIRRKIATKSK